MSWFELNIWWCLPWPPLFKTVSQIVLSEVHTKKYWFDFHFRSLISYAFILLLLRNIAHFCWNSRQVSLGPLTKPAHCCGACRIESVWTRFSLRHYRSTFLIVSLNPFCANSSFWNHLKFTNSARSLLTFLPTNPLIRSMLYPTTEV